jgi:peptidyl-tRNA hydrolase, PTH1 family
MRVVVGLGNPGPRYRETRHNVGFDVVALLARRTMAEGPKKKFDAELFDCGGAWGDKLLLVAPQTYMNLSGKSVRGVLDFYKLSPQDLLVVCDDINLPLGKLRIRQQGTAGGQKGLADILRQAGTESVPRLRMGVGAPPGPMDAADWVLGKFTSAEQMDVERMTAIAADAVEVWVREGLASAMNRFNTDGESGDRRTAGPSSKGVASKAAATKSVGPKGDKTAGRDVIGPGQDATGQQAIQNPNEVNEPRESLRGPEGEASQ